MTATDSILARYTSEIEDRQKFIDGLTEAAERETRDLEPKELELITRSRDRIQVVNGMLGPLQDAARIAAQSRETTARLASEFAVARRPEAAQVVEYRSAGHYAMDMWKAGLGQTDARERLELYNRAAAHQTTTDTTGLLPEQILGPVVDFVDQSRPLTAALGPRQLPSGSWSRPQVTQHTQVAAQSAEKTELVSRKMIIGKLPVEAVTYGGYVNVARQLIDWSQPQALDIIINDLAGQYAIETENALADALATAATAGADLPGTPTAADVSGALWAAAGAVFAATAGQGRLIAVASPDMLGLIGPLFAPVNPQNAQSTGFNAGQFGTGAMGAISGISVVVSAGLDANTVLVLSSAAAEVYEDRVGALQVVEPSVLGVQVAYAGYFAPLVIEAAGIIKVVR